MKRLALLLALAAASACAPSTRDGFGPQLRPTANPSAVIAAELGFSQLAQVKGQWTAFRATAADGAEMFVPERVKAADWLKGRADPSVAVKWQPHAVWSSCDGSYAVTRGVWERPGSAGSFITVWQRQKDSKYKWLLDMSLADERPAPAPDMVNAIVADCAGRNRDSQPMAITLPTDTPETKSGKANDGSLGWLSQTGGQGAREFTLWITKDGSMREVLKTQFGARTGN